MPRRWGSAYDANGDADAQASQFSRQIGGLRVTVIAKDGTVLGDSAADYKTMENHAGREELKAAEGAGVGISVRPSETLGTRLMYAAVRTQGGEYIRVAMQYNGFLQGPCKPAARSCWAPGWSLLQWRRSWPRAWRKP